MTTRERGRATFVRQVGWEQRSFWRNPSSAAFTFAFPLLFLVVFIAINGNDTVHLPGRARCRSRSSTCRRSSRSA